MAAGKPGPVVPQRYVDALAGDDPVDAMDGAPKRFARLLAGLTESQLAIRPAPGKWSMKEILAHLADGEVILGSRIRFAAAMDRPPIHGYDQDAFVDNLGTEKAKAKELLDAYAAVRKVNVALLRRLPPAAFEKVGIHSERGAESVRAMVVMYAGHDRIHEAQVETLRLALFPKTKRPVARKKSPKTAPRTTAKGKGAKKASGKRGR